MKIFKILLFFNFVILILAPAPNSGQVLSISEADRTGKVIPIDLTKQNTAIIDINNSLLIKIAREEIKESVIKFFKPNMKKQTSEIKKITEILGKQNQMLDILASTEGSYEQRKKNLSFFSQNMYDLIDSLKKEAALRKKLNEILGSDDNEYKQYSMIFELARQKINTFNSEFDKLLNDEKVYFRLGGWLRYQNGEETPIHIPQFDTYENGKFYEVPRFVMPTTKELEDQYSAAAKAAEEYNAKGQTSFDVLKSRLSNLEESFLKSLDCAKSNIERNVKIVSSVKGLNDRADNLVKSSKGVVNKIDELYKIIDGINAAQTSFNTAVASFNTAVGIIKSIKVDVSGIIDEFNKAKKQFGEGMKLVQTDSLKKMFIEAITETEKCLTQFNEKCKASLDTDFKEIQYWLGLSVPEQSKINSELTEKVKSFLLEDIPESTEVDLRNTGQRSAGDEIHLKAFIEQKADKDEKSVPRELEHRSFTMFQIGLHTQLTACVVFLDPTNNSKTKLVRQFQAAPSYSLLFKFGFRKSYVLNKFWDFGFGINISAPDFNLDSDPEIGLGVVATAVKDYFQIGAGRNMGVDTWYWFFGLKLPVGAITLTNDNNSDD